LIYCQQKAIISRLITLAYPAEQGRAITRILVDEPYHQLT